MYLKYGSYQFPVAAVFIARSFATLFSEEQVPFGVAHAWAVNGNLIGNGQADLIAQQAALQVALGVPYRDLVFYADDNTPAFALPNAGSVSGVQIKNLNLPSEESGVFATKVPFSFNAEATYPYAVGSLLLDFSEVLSIAGGGPKYEFTETVNTLPIKSLLTPYAVCRVTQSGSSKALGGYEVPGPLFPGDLLEEPTINYTSPKRSGQGFWEYAASWSYSFGGAIRLAGFPNAN